MRRSVEDEEGLSWCGRSTATTTTCAHFELGKPRRQGYGGDEADAAERRVNDLVVGDDHVAAAR